ncbi:MAG: acyl-CoA dehydrogenase [Pseudomonadales bacterium]|nr:acyl-CoA dehydrogenase [Pseudomonadales bacterium]MCP5182518.1 acyl-CoA dehydrogenase [Pseudomonadales bacterium]
MKTPTQHILEAAHTLREDAIPGDRQGNLTQRTVDILRASGGFRLLLARDLGGYEEHPNEFLNWAMAVGAQQPSAGWIAGVVGVHPWEISFMHPRLQQEIYGEDPDTWAASPYAPFGRARPVDGGFLLTGEWPYSTGTDYSQWVILGGVVINADGSTPEGPPDVRHFVLPRGDYEIVDGSWNVMGLKGTGSKNVRMTDAFVPDYRVVESSKVNEGVYAEERRPGSPLYALGFGVMFPAAIAAGTLGIAGGYLREQRSYMAGRISVMGKVAKSDPAYLTALAVAESDLAASRCHLLHITGELYDYVKARNKVTPEQRLRFRLDQVRATDRVYETLAPLARLAGSAGIQEANGLERWWRDLHTAITHVCNVRNDIYFPWGLHSFGGDIPPGTLY